MDEKYPNLHALLASDTRARAYFDGLPGYVQQSIFERASGVNSYESLRDYAENLTRGDN
nr:hypothetical protein [Maliibacterium massiliense]